VTSFDALKARVVDMTGSTIASLGDRRVRVAATDATGVDILVNGVRVRLTWGRLEASLRRLAANHTLSVDELGGGIDAVGLVSALASALGSDVLVNSDKDLLVVRERVGTPIHQYAAMDASVHRSRPQGL